MVIVKYIYIILCLSGFIISAHAHADEAPEKDWGIAVGIRSAKIPYFAKEDRVDDFIPLLYYDGDLFFIRGLTGGIKLYQKDEWQFNFIGRYRYFDIPAEYQNLINVILFNSNINMKKIMDNIGFIITKKFKL